MKNCEKKKNVDKKKKIKNKKTKRKHDREKIEREGEKKNKIQCIFPNGFHMQFM